MAGNHVGQISSVQVILNFVSTVKDFRFHSKCNGESLKAFRRGAIRYNLCL